LIARGAMPVAGAAARRRLHYGFSRENQGLTVVY
jgi:hypothetical protein